ncbi:MAG TPA: hypothetical protein VFI78_00880 [Salinimicrobium sp.]|nr:hypothetical protein [Salinimicrobium sp.]
MENLKIGWSTGFAVIISVVIVAVIIYTVIKVRKQAGEAEEARRKSEREFSAKQQNEKTRPKNKKNN